MKTILQSVLQLEPGDALDDLGDVSINTGHRNNPVLPPFPFLMLAHWPVSSLPLYLPPTHFFTNPKPEPGAGQGRVL